MVEIIHQGIYIDYDNDPAPQNVPRHGETTSGICNWRREGIVFPRKSEKLQNYFAYFRHYSHDAVLRISLIHLFFILFLDDYLEQVLISDTNKGLSVPINLQ